MGGVGQNASECREGPLAQTACEDSAGEGDPVKWRLERCPRRGSQGVRTSRKARMSEALFPDSVPVHIWGKFSRDGLLMERRNANRVPGAMLEQCQGCNVKDGYFRGNTVASLLLSIAVQGAAHTL